MHKIQPRILRDENQQPVAVQIDYAEWVEIEKQLGLKQSSGNSVDLTRFAGCLEWPEDAVAYQRRVREEWDR